MVRLLNIAQEVERRTEGLTENHSKDLARLEEVVTAIKSLRPHYDTIDRYDELYRERENILKRLSNG